MGGQKQKTSALLNFVYKKRSIYFQTMSDAFELDSNTFAVNIRTTITQMYTVLGMNTAVLISVYMSIFHTM